MKPKARSLLTVGLILAIGLLTFSPTANAFTWTTVLTRDQGYATATVVRPIAGLSITEDIYLILHGDVVNGDFVSLRCLRSTTSCTATMIDNSDAGTQFDAHQITPQTTYACYSDAGASNIHFTKTTSGGQFWASPTTLATTNVLDRCGITAFNTTLILASYIDQTTGLLDTSLSTNGGATWTETATTFAAGATGYTDAGVTQTRIFTHSSTHYTILIPDSVRSSIHTCRTTDTGATWTCTQDAISIATNGYLTLTYPGPNIAAFCAVTSTSVVFAFSDDLGISWGQTTVATHGGDVHTCGIDAFTAQEYGVSFTNTASTALGKFSHTTDAGATWSAAETTYTHGVAPTGTAHGSATIFAPSGDALSAHQFSQGNVRLAVAEAGVSTVLLTAAATASVTNLVGFDVDTSGTTAIARVDSGDDIQVWGAQSLGTPAGTVTGTQCNRVHGVMATFSHVAYLDCDGSNNVEAMVIRSANLGPPNYGDCIGCPSEIDFTTLVGDDFPENQDALEITEIVTFPISQTNRNKLFSIQVFCEGSFECQVSRVAWGFSTGSGLIGTAVFGHVEGHPDEGDEAFVSFGPSPASQISTFKAGPDVYLAGASGTETTKAYRVAVSESGNADDIDIQIALSNPVFVGSASINQAEGIDCVGYKCLIYQGFSNRVSVINSTTGAILLGPIQTSGGASHNVALSTTQNRAAFYDGTTVNVIDSTTGETICSLEMPAGTFRDVEIDSSAQNVWVATQDNIARFNLPDAGCSVEAPTVIDPDPDIDTPGEEPQGIDAAAAAVGNLFGLGVEGGKVILGLLVMIILAAIGFVITGGWKKAKLKQDLRVPSMTAAAFAAAGFVANGALKIWPMWVILGLILIGLVIFFLLRPSPSTARP